jgi:hypothetical protein
VKWGDFERDGGVLADRARALLERPGLVLVATIRSDGTPRVSPVEPFFWDGELWLGMMWRSRKAADLRRDSRVLVHSVVASPVGGEGEAKIRGRAIFEADVGRRSAFCVAVVAALPHWGEVDPDRVELFRVDVESASVVSYGSSGDQHVLLWPSRRSFVRRATSGTSVGEPEAEESF